VSTGADVPAERRGGNAECALVLSIPRAQIAPEQFLQHYGLDRAFGPHVGAIPVTLVGPWTPSVPVDVGEVLYDPTGRTLSFHGEVLDARVRRILVEPSGIAAGPAHELGVNVNGERFVKATWDARWLEDTDPGTGLRRLRTHEVRVVALDDAGGEIGAVCVRVNVQFVDALEVHDNLLVGPAAVSPDALLVPSTAPPEQRVAAVKRKLDALREARSVSASGSFRHQASLDVFYRNVRRGLDARWRLLDANRGSRFALLRWSFDLRRALAAATTDSLDAPRRAFLVQRTAEHVERVLDKLAEWTSDPAAVKGVLAQAELARALRGIPIEDACLGVIAREVAVVRDRVIVRLEEVPA
jgi:hypothetical protein